MSFGPESTNPRERRAYAHAAIARAKRTGALEDFTEAEQAVLIAGESRKSKKSGFIEGLFKALMSDESTRIILETAYDIDSTVNNPIYSKLEPSGKVHISVGRRSPGYRAGLEGVWMGRFGISDAATGEVDKLTYMWVADFDADTNRKTIIPGTENGNLDPRAIRLMPDDARHELADVVSRVA